MALAVADSGQARSIKPKRVSSRLLSCSMTSKRGDEQAQQADLIKELRGNLRSTEEDLRHQRSAMAQYQRTEVSLRRSSNGSARRE